MQIQLKQAEIIEALKQYIAKKGISLNGKEVLIDFTSGRKNNGLSADISIEDILFPLPADEAPRPSLTVVTSLPVIEEPPAVEAAAPVAIADTPAKSLFS